MVFILPCGHGPGKTLPHVPVEFQRLHLKKKNRKREGTERKNGRRGRGQGARGGTGSFRGLKFSWSTTR